MASIYTNLRTERQYRASTGLSEQTFNQLFEQFKRFYVPKKGNSAEPSCAPKWRCEREQYLARLTPATFAQSCLHEKAIRAMRHAVISRRCTLRFNPSVVNSFQHIGILIASGFL